MEPITTAIVTAVATGLAQNVVKDGYEKLKSLIFGAAPDKKPELEAAIAAVDKAQTELDQMLAAAVLSQNTAVLKQAAVLMEAAGNHIAVTGNQNATALNGGKAVVVTGNAGNISL